MQTAGRMGMTGDLGLEITRRPATSVVPGRPLSLAEVVKYGAPQRGLSEAVNRWRAKNFPGLIKGYRRIWLARKLGIPHFYGCLSLVVTRADGSFEELGLASFQKVTQHATEWVVDSFQNLKENEDFKYHALGTNNTAESNADQALGTEWVAADYTGGVRATGTTTEGASANIYRTVGTVTKANAGTSAVVEHGVMSSATIGGVSATNRLLDRSVFSAVNLSQNDSITATYDMTFSPEA